MDTVHGRKSSLLDSDAKRPAIAGGSPAKTSPFSHAARYGQEELDELRQALDQGTLFFARGSKVRSLESDFAAYVGTQHAIATSSGTAAIHAALISAGVSPGDEVIVPPITDMGSIAPILYQGAVPVFADLDPTTYNLHPISVEQNITPRTRAIIAVHLAGNACDMHSLVRIAEARGLALIEDCAQAHGCLYEGRMVGTMGHSGCFSFNEFKHISCGDGGILVTNDQPLADKCRLAIDKCYTREFAATRRTPTFLANNYRMTELQAAVARAQLRKLDGIISRRRRWCAELSRRLAGTPGLSLPRVTPGCEPSWWFYLMRVRPTELGASADEIAKALHAEGLPTVAHYIGQPIYQYPLFTNHSAFERGDHPFKSREYGRGLCPQAESILETCVMLPINEGYSSRDLDETVAAIRRVFHWFADGRP